MVMVMIKRFQFLEQGEPRNDPKIENTKNDDPKSLFVPESGNYFSSGSSSSKTTTTIKDGVKRTVVTGGEEKVKHKIWEIAFYMEFFDIDAGDVVNRCLRAVFPFRFNFVEIIHEKPDLYGPFWITTSLIFLMAIAANFASYLDTFTNGGFNYDFYKIPYGAAVLYGYVFIIPISFYLFLKWVEIKISFVEILCVYGYSLFVYTPVALICAIPSQISQWIAVSIGCFISTIFLVFNLWVPVRERIAKAFILLIVITVLHVGLALSFKLYFFNFVNPIPTPIPSSTNTPGPTTNPF